MRHRRNAPAPFRRLTEGRRGAVAYRAETAPPIASQSAAAETGFVR